MSITSCTLAPSVRAPIERENRGNVASPDLSSTPSESEEKSQASSALPSKMLRSLFSDIEPAYLRQMKPKERQNTVSFFGPDRFICPRSTRNDSLVDLEPCLPPTSLSKHQQREALYSSLLGYPNPREQRVLSSKATPPPRLASCSISELDSVLQELYAAPPAPTLPHKKLLADAAILSYDMPRIFDDYYTNRMSLCSATGEIACVSDAMSGPKNWLDKIFLMNPMRPKESRIPICDDPDALSRFISCVHFNGVGLILGTRKLTDPNPDAPIFHAIEYWSPDENGVWIKFAELQFENRGTNAIAYVNDKTYVGGNDGRLYVIDTENLSLERVFDCRTRICNLVLSPSGRYLAAGLDKHRVDIFDLHNNEFLTSCNTKSAVKAIAFNPDNEMQIAVGGGLDRPSLFLFDLQRKLLLEEKPMGHQFTGLFWKKDNVLISSHNDGRVCFTPVHMKRPSHFLGNPLEKLGPSKKRLSYPQFLENRDGPSYLFVAEGDKNQNYDPAAKHRILAFEVPQKPSRQAPSLLTQPLRV